MRALLGLLVLGMLFVMAGSWQSRTTRRQHDARARSYNTSSDTSLGGDWSRLLVGRASGADPLPVPEDLPELQFETSGALMALARASRNPQSPPLPSLGLLDRHRREAG